MEQKAVFSYNECPKCKYVRAEQTESKDKKNKHFICYRCGYLNIISEESNQEHHGLGSWIAVFEQGIVASAVYADKKEFDEKLDEIKKMFQGGKILYTRKDSIGRYLLVDTETGMKYPFEDDDEVCFEGLRKLTKIN